MEPFFGTPIRVFSSSDEAAATAWLLESPPEGATITFLPESEGALVALRVTGRLRDVDYETLKAELTRRLLESGKLRMLVIMDEAFGAVALSRCQCLCPSYRTGKGSVLALTFPDGKYPSRLLNRISSDMRL